jgi:nucleotide-binding universal stress UspA family protein
VILGTEAGRAIKDILLGSTATQLMRKCPCAVWVVKPGRATRRDTVMAAVDAPVGQSPEPLSTKILDLAAALARAQGGRLHVVHCWDVDGSEAEMLRSEITDDTRRAILQRHERRHRDAVEPLIARHRGSLDEIEAHLPRGPVQPAIVSLAEQRDVGLVVMGVPGRSGLSGLLAGNSVERVLDLVHCDVLAVKPDEFRTPVAVHSVGAQADLHGR